MKSVLIIGTGMVGSTIAGDLCKEYKVTAADIDPVKLDFLKHKLLSEIETIDLSDKKASGKLAKGFDLVIGAVPGHMGFETLKTIINSGQNIVDISFFNENPFELDELAKLKNVTAIIDCGIAPGMSNIILGYYNNFMKVENFECLVGGLPFKRTLPFQYKAAFSPIDVIEEYTRPARLVENGKVVVKPALSDPELVEIEPVGTLESFNTDGLRTLLRTMKIPFMKEKTLRYPGHIEIIKIFKDCGFFNNESMIINGKEIKPIDLTSKLLFPLWKLDEHEEEFVIMSIKIVGKESGTKKEYHYSLFDRFDATAGTSSMARTTGYTCTSVARLVLEGKFTRTGIIPPEYVGADLECFSSIIEDLKQRNIHFSFTEKILS
jgi:saccharopine dehydrogenase-like NADP-dependent oxidoreductase